VAGEVSGKVDFRSKVKCSEKLLVIFTEERVDGRVTTDEHRTLRQRLETGQDVKEKR